MKTSILAGAWILIIVLSVAPSFAGVAPHHGVKGTVYHHRTLRAAPVTDDGPVITLPG